MDSVGFDDDLQGAFGSLFEIWAGGGVGCAGAVSVRELEGSGAENFETIVKISAWGEGLGAEAGAGVVDFDEGDGGRGLVADGGCDVGGTASGEGGEADGEREDAYGTHEVQGIRVGARC